MTPLIHLPLILSLVYAPPAASDGSGRADVVRDFNYVALDIRTREVIEQRWSDINGSDINGTDINGTDVNTPIPLGSLVKPFTALAYGGAYPEFVCKGKASGCWLAHGHGRMRFREALAQSCNAYFLNLAHGVDPGTLAVVTGKFGISSPDGASPETRIGLGNGWRISPLAMVRAYAELSSRMGEPRVSEIFDGLELAARSGTASVIGGRAFAKTGTAPHEGVGTGVQKRSSDGFTLVLAPADAPRIALLVRVRGVTGAEAAKSAARILREMRARP